MKRACLVVLLAVGWSSLHRLDLVSGLPSDKMRAQLGHGASNATTSPTTSGTTPADVTALGEANATLATRIPYNCSETHRAHKNDSNKFQVRHNSIWWDQVCQTGLVWNQTLCRCEYPPDGVAMIPECPDYRSHGNQSGKYEQRVNDKWIIRDCNLAVSGLVWNQTTCRCEWGPDGDASLLDFDRSTPCDTMLNVTFEEGLVDDAKSSFLELPSGSSVALRHYTSREGQLNKAAYFEDAAMTVWYFAGNELSGSLRVEFMFKAENSPATRGQYQILLSNGCNVTGLGYTTPSLAVGYRAEDKSFLLALHTSNVRKAIVCTRKLEAFDWHHVSLIYEDGTLLFRVNNHPCIISNDFSGEVEKTPCPLTIGSDPLEKESRYVGYLDNLVIARYCRRFVEQEMLPDEHSEDGTESRDVSGKEKKGQKNDDANDGEKTTKVTAAQQQEDDAAETEKRQKSLRNDVMNALM